MDECFFTENESLRLSERLQNAVDDEFKNRRTEEYLQKSASEFGVYVSQFRDENGHFSVAGMVAFEYLERRKRARDLILSAIRMDSHNFVGANEWFDYKEVVLEAVIMDGLLLEYASERIKDDIDVVMAAIGSDFLAIKFASNRIRDNKQIMMKVVSQNGLLLCYGSPKIKSDREIVTASILNDGRAIQYACEGLKCDRDIAFLAVCQNGASFLYISKKLWFDKGIVMKAVNDKSYLLLCLDKKLLDDKDVILAAYVNDKSAIKYASERVKDEIRFDLIMSAGKYLYDQEKCKEFVKK